MKKKIMTLVLTTAMTAAAGLTAFAGEWKSNDTGWWWLNDDGSNPAAEWKWLDGNKDGTFECYYFGNDGYMLSDTTTPDNYQVNKDGAWIVDGGHYILAGEDGKTSQPGIFAAGDVRTKNLRQIVTAVADGANCVTSAERYLNGQQ